VHRSEQITSPIEDSFDRVSLSTPRCDHKCNIEQVVKFRVMPPRAQTSDEIAASVRTATNAAAVSVVPIGTDSFEVHWPDWCLSTATWLVSRLAIVR
jgi:hypothetical protein